jgi:hypothetical protein
MQRNVLVYGSIAIVSVIAIIFAVYENWAAVAALAALAAVIIAIQQTSLSRMTMGADLIMRLNDQFEDKEFQRTRSDAAIAIRRLTPQNKGRVEDVFDFFDTIGILVRRGALDKELAWSRFFYWLHGYHRWAKPFLDEQRKAFPNRYADFVWLHSKLAKIEVSKEPMNEVEWDDFLDEEYRCVN